MERLHSDRKNGEGEDADQQSRTQILFRTVSGGVKAEKEGPKTKPAAGTGRPATTATNVKPCTVALLKQVAANSGRGEITTYKMANTTRAKITDLIQPCTAP